MTSQKVKLPNKHLAELDSDFLFHLEIPLDDQLILSTFTNVRFVCVGGTSSRMESLALHLAEELGLPGTQGSPLDFSFKNERFAGYKVGPVFCVSHGIGLPSISIVLHEVFKLLQKAHCCDVTLIRIGTCGGIGIPPGAVVISTASLTAGLEPVYRTSSLGQPLNLPTTADPKLADILYSCRSEKDEFDVVKGKTYCAEDFYQGQGRLDGSFCDYSRQDKEDFLRRLSDCGVLNLEMESAAVLGMSYKVGIKAAVVCSVIVDRLKSDLPLLSKDELVVAQNNAITLVSRHIRQQLSQ